MRTSFSETQDCILGNSEPSLRDLIMLLTYTQDYPGFLHAALDRSAYAAFSTESRVRLGDSTMLHRKSGSVLGYSQPSLRDCSDSR